MIQPTIYLQDLTPQQLQLGLNYEDQQCFDVAAHDANDPNQKEKIQRIFNRSVCALSKAQQDRIATLYRERMPASIYQLYENSIKARRNIVFPNFYYGYIIERLAKVGKIHDSFVQKEYGIGEHIFHPYNVVNIQKILRDRIYNLFSTLSHKQNFSTPQEYDYSTQRWKDVLYQVACCIADHISTELNLSDADWYAKNRKILSQFYIEGKTGGSVVIRTYAKTKSV